MRGGTNGHVVVVEGNGDVVKGTGHSVEEDAAISGISIIASSGLGELCTQCGTGL
jgi:hypothetical protein